MFSWDDLIYLAPIYIVCHALYLVYYAVDLYQFNPFFKLIPLSKEQQALIEANFPIYLEFSPELRAKCNKRIIWFRSKKHFVFYGDINKREELKLILSATAVIMTLAILALFGQPLLNLIRSKIGQKQQQNVFDAE